MLLDEVCLMDQPGERCPVGFYELDGERVLIPGQLWVVLAHVLPSVTIVEVVLLVLPLPLPDGPGALPNVLVYGLVFLVP